MCILKTICIMLKHVWESINKIMFKLTSRKCLYMTGISLNMGKWSPDKHII